jgi:hypothetical protein
MAGTYDSFLDLTYDVLFHPIRAFRTVADETPPRNRWLGYALIILVFVSGSGPILSSIGKANSFGGLVFSIPMLSLWGLFIWFFMALVMAMLGYIFRGQTSMKTFLTLSALATLPWIFLGPIILLKHTAGILGSIVGAFGVLVIWLWTVVLFAMAVSITYRLTVDRLILFLILPLMMGLVYCAWFVGFIANLILMYPSS